MREKGLVDPLPGQEDLVSYDVSYVVCSTIAGSTCNRKMFLARIFVYKSLCP